VYISVVLPTYNERLNIIRLIVEIRETIRRAGAKYEILVIDDNSPDQTAELINQEFKADYGVSVIKRLDERGLATAVKEGLEKAKGEILLLMDTDFNHEPKYIPDLLDRIESNDIVLGSRYIKGGGMPGARLRVICSGIFNFFIRVMLGLPTKDNLSGFLAIRREAWEKIRPFRDDIFRGYGEFCIRFLYCAFRKRLRIAEIPVLYGYRISGESKTQFLKHLIDYAISVFELKIRGKKAYR